MECTYPDWGMGVPNCPHYRREDEDSNGCRYEWSGECHLLQHQVGYVIRIDDTLEYAAERKAEDQHYLPKPTYILPTNERVTTNTPFSLRIGWLIVEDAQAALDQHIEEYGRRPNKIYSIVKITVTEETL